MLLLGSYFIYMPKWGLMDDWQNRQIADVFWGSSDKSTEFSRLMDREVNQHGRFRPFYYCWILSVYKIFYNNPFMLNLIICIVNLLMIAVWGKIFALILKKTGYSDSDYFAYIYPFLFFVFTPFWNNFMYISLQEKFVFWFSSLACYFLVDGTMEENMEKLWIAFLLIVIALMSKETSLSILFSFVAVIFLNMLCANKVKSRLRYLPLLFTACLFVFVYGLSIKSIVGGYTQTYAENSSSMINMLLKFNHIPQYAKLLIAMSGFASIFCCIVYIIKRTYLHLFSMFFAMCLFFYLLLMLPWGYPTYMLAPLAPFIFGMFLCAVLFIHKRLGLVLNVGSISLIFLFVIFVGLPNVSLCADKTKIITFITNNIKSEDIIFFPMPYEESAQTIKKFSGKNIVFLEEGELLPEMLASQGDNYLVFHEGARAVNINDIAPGKIIYQNLTWKLYELDSDDKKQNFLPVFHLNPLQKLKRVIRSFK